MPASTFFCLLASLSLLIGNAQHRQSKLPPESVTEALQEVSTREATSTSFLYEKEFIAPIPWESAPEAVSQLGNTLFSNTSDSTTRRGYRAAAAPVISSVTNGASFQPGLVAGSWVTIRGTNLANTIRDWDRSDFDGDYLPTVLDGVSVSVNSKPAFVQYLSPSQVNVLAPNDMATGPVSVAIRNSYGAAESVATLERVAPAFFAFDPENRRYVAAVHRDGALGGKPGLFGTARSTRPFEAGERALLFGTGFGVTNPAVAAGLEFAGAAETTEPPEIYLGEILVRVEFAGLVSNGLYQFNIVIPSLPPGDYPISARMRGASSPGGTYLTVGVPGPQDGLLSCGDLVSGKIASISQVDVFTLRQRAGARIEFTLAETSHWDFTAAAAVLTLVAPSGAQVVTFASPEQRAVALPEDGEYTIEIKSNNYRGSTGSYNLGVECLAPLPGGERSLSCGELVSGNIAAPAQVDLLTFNRSAGGRVRFTVAETSNWGYTAEAATVTIVAPSGAEVARFDSPAQQDIALPESGLYVVLVGANRWGGFASKGSYSLGIECLGPA